MITETFFIDNPPPIPVTEPITNRQLFFRYPAARKPQYRTFDASGRRYVFTQMIDTDPRAIIMAYVRAEFLTQERAARLQNWERELLSRPYVLDAVGQGVVEVERLLSLSSRGRAKMNNPVLMQKMADGTLTLNRVILMSQNEVRRFEESAAFNTRLGRHG